jgi:hypothetical protein
MPSYPVVCYTPGCGAAAAFKIAAVWSDGSTRELKTYSLACEACVPDRLADAVRRRAACRLAPDEVLGQPTAHELARRA